MMKILKSTYQGYIWYSDADKPQIFNNEVFELEINETDKPFIIEGYLFDGINSISVKYIDGHYINKTFTLDELKNVEYTEQIFLGHRMEGKQLRFRQYWRPLPDENCEGMTVLKPAENIFVGFNNKED